MILVRMIPWNNLEIDFSYLYQSGRNVRDQATKPMRLMLEIILLQHLHNWSDEQAVRKWAEKSLLVEFLWLQDFRNEASLSISSSLTNLRNKLGSNRMEKILSPTVSIAIKSEAVKVKDLKKKVIFDNTVMPNNIEFSTRIQALQQG